MSDELGAMLLIAGAFVLPQAAGFMAGRARPGHRPRSWEWPVVAAAFFATGWYVVWWLPSALRSEPRQQCGLAAAVLMIPLVFLTPFHAVLGAVLQWWQARGAPTRDVL